MPSSSPPPTRLRASHKTTTMRTPAWSEMFHVPSSCICMWYIRIRNQRCKPNVVPIGSNAKCVHTKGPFAHPVVALIGIYGCATGALNQMLSLPEDVCTPSCHPVVALIGIYGCATGAKALVLLQGRPHYLKISTSSSRHSSHKGKQFTTAWIAFLTA